MKIYSTSEWKKLFLNNEKKIKNLKKVDNAFVAFNANIDAIKVVNNDFGFTDINSDCALPKKIMNLIDLKKAIVNSMKKGTALELKIENNNFYKKLSEELKFNKKRIGGQMGITANTLSKLGVKKVIVYSNLLSDKQTSLFHKNILFPKIINKKIRFVDVKTAGKKNHKTRMNIIFEFKKGEKIKLKDKIIIIPRSNRFILSSPIENSNPIMPKRLLPLFKEIKRVFFSGYHHVSKKDYKSVFKEWIFQIKEIKKINPDIIIHIEYVDLHKDWLNKEIFKVLKHVDSLGLNEVEIINIMNYLKIKGYSKIYDNNLVSAGDFLIQKFGLKRVNIHTIDYVINLSVKDYPFSYESILHSNIFGMRVVNSKGIKGENFMKELKEINKYPLNINGMNVSRKNFNTTNNLVIVPNFETDKVPVNYTVGLGDTISSSIFYSEGLDFK